MLKWTAAGDPRRRYLKLQGEYMDRTEDGDLSYTALAPTLSDSYRASQSGWYVQGVYQFLPRWRVGARYDSLDSGTPKIGLIESGTLGWEDFPLLAPATPSRTTLMLDWNLSEFSRLRTQYAWDDARPGPTDEQFFLQYIYALGAHGAHKF
jgi:outer membrane receptor protein involved in Fe transport